MSEIKERPAHQQRVIAERLDLNYKVEKLSTFIGGGTGPVFIGLPLVDRELLIEQEVYMKGYLAALDKRIARFDPIE